MTPDHDIRSVRDIDPIFRDAMRIVVRDELASLGGHLLATYGADLAVTTYAEPIGRITVLTKRVCIRCGTRYPANSECPHHPRESRPAWRTTKGTKQQRGYGRDHDHLRRTILAMYPLCQDCGVAPSTIADHKRNLKRGGTNTLDNYQALCAGCHKRKTGREAHA